MSVHLIHDIACQAGPDLYHAVVEIPAGTNEKWHVTFDNGGVLAQEYRDGRPRLIRFLSYPFNYGFIPQTYAAPEERGDGDPLDVLILGAALPRGSTQAVRVLGGLYVEDRGDVDTKLVAITPEGLFGDVSDLIDLEVRFPGLLEALTLWFRYYKGPDAVQVKGTITQTGAVALIEQQHRHWENAF